jgi:hypothetical protein
VHREVELKKVIIKSEVMEKERKGVSKYDNNIYRA